MLAPSKIRLINILLISCLFLWLLLWLIALVWLFLIDTNWFWLYVLAVACFSLFGLVVSLLRKQSQQASTLLSRIQYLETNAFSNLYERSPVAYLVIDEQGFIKESNPAGVYLLGSTIDTIRGQNLFSIIALNDEDHDESLSILKSKIARKLVINNLELPINNLSKHKLWAQISVTGYQNDSERLVSIVDVSEKKQVDIAKSEFVALATHQLRTPVSAVRWNVELLRKKLKDLENKDWERYLLKVEKNIRRMNMLIDDFLSVSKLEMGTFATKKEAINLVDFIDGIIEEYSEKITEKSLTINKPSNTAGLVLDSDPNLLHIIVSNLVSNSVKYLSHGGELSIECQPLNSNLRIVISDNGIGIPSAEVEHLFTKFFRASNAQSHHTEGTGLGLYVVKQSVELLGGSITVESGENKGARFTILLPQ